MLKLIPGLRDRVIGSEAIGKVEADDHRQLLDPAAADQMNTVKVFALDDAWWRPDVHPGPARRGHDLNERERHLDQRARAAVSA